jgi:ferric iron reductase protein FhuF
MAELVDEPEIMAGRIHRVRAALAASAGCPPAQIQERVAASITQMGLVARLVAPILASLTTGRAGLEPRLSQIWWQDELGGPFPVSFAPLPADSRDGDPDVGHVLDGPVGQLTEAVRGQVAVSARVLWGNVASAVNSVSNQLAASDPVVAARVSAVTAKLFADRRLQSETCAPGAGFRRSSCCLIYRLAPGGTAGVCGDCVLGSSG